MYLALKGCFDLALHFFFLLKMLHVGLLPIGSDYEYICDSLKGCLLRIGFKLLIRVRMTSENVAFRLTISSVLLL